MKDYTKFDISDLGAQQNPGWRVRWGAEGSNAVLLVNTQKSIEDSEWKLLWCDEDPEITLSADGVFLPRESVTIHEKIYRIPHPAPKILPSILVSCYKEHYSNIPAPRHKNPEPYIPQETAKTLERKFFETLIAPYLRTHTVYAVAESGLQLCYRLGVTWDVEIDVSHYESSTFQNDSGIHVEDFPILNYDKPVLVIDDMVSSGHTAAAILDKFRKQGVDKVRYVALFNVVASREDHEVDSAIETCQDISNFYWMYGRGMDLLDEQSRRTKHIYGADKSYEEFEEDIDDLRNFFNQQP